jgi:hypothetical protein
VKDAAIEVRLWMLRPLKFSFFAFGMFSSDSLWPIISKAEALSLCE